MGEPESLRDLPLVYVDRLDRPRLHPDDLHHFRSVLRVADGAPIAIGDGQGAWRTAAFGPEPTDLGPRCEAPPPEPLITIAFTPVKGARPEWVVQKLTELGVDRIAPVTTERSVVRWDRARAARVHERMLVAAREACLQSRRLWLPTVDLPQPLASFLEAHPGAVAADPGGRALDPPPTTVVVGPEGGFGPGELDGVDRMALPGGILRAETAAVVAAAVACGLRSGLLAPGEP